MTAPLPGALQSSASVKHCIDVLTQALEAPADAEVPDSELATVGFSHERIVAPNGAGL